MINNDVEDLVVTLLMILARSEDTAGRVRIGHEGGIYVVDVVVEREDDVVRSSQVGRGRTMAEALRALLFRLHETGRDAWTN